jgi:hypothetical protein
MPVGDDRSFVSFGGNVLWKAAAMREDRKQDAITYGAESARHLANWPLKAIRNVSWLTWSRDAFGQRQARHRLKLHVESEH